MFAVVEVDKCRVTFHSFLLAEVVVLSFGAVNSGVSNLKEAREMEYGKNVSNKGTDMAGKDAKLLY